MMFLKTEKLQKNYWLIPIVLSVFFFLIFAIHSIYKHTSYNSAAYDLGIYEQGIYQYSQGINAYSSIMQRNLLANHFGPILILLAPFYKLYPDPNFLLIIQALFVSISLIPIYLIAYSHTKNMILAILLSVCYISSPAILNGISFDFHLATISTLPLSLVLYFWYFKKWRLYFLAIFFSLLFKEDIPIFILGLGIYEFFFRREKRIAFITIIISIITILITKFLLMPLLQEGAQNYYLDESTLPLNNPPLLIYMLIFYPLNNFNIIFGSQIKTDTLQQLFGQYAYLPILSPLSWLTVIPSLILRFSFSEPNFWKNIFHYNTNLSPFLAVSTILVLAKFKLSAKFLIPVFIFILITGSFQIGNIFWHPLFLNPFSNSKYDYINESLQLIPPSASVSAQTAIVPHIANRTSIYSFPDIRDAKYIILDPEVNFYPIPNKDKYNEAVIGLLNSNWSIIYQNKSLSILKKNIL